MSINIIESYKYIIKCNDMERLFISYFIKSLKCICGLEIDRDKNASINLGEYKLV